MLLLREKMGLTNLDGRECISIQQKETDMWDHFGLADLDDYKPNANCCQE